MTDVFRSSVVMGVAGDVGPQWLNIGTFHVVQPGRGHQTRGEWEAPAFIQPPQSAVTWSDAVARGSHAESSSARERAGVRSHQNQARIGSLQLTSLYTHFPVLDVSKHPVPRRFEASCLVALGLLTL